MDPTQSVLNPAWMQALPLPDTVAKGIPLDLALHDEFVQMRITSSNTVSSSWCIAAATLIAPVVNASLDYLGRTSSTSWMQDKRETWCFWWAGFQHQYLEDLGEWAIASHGKGTHPYRKVTDVDIKCQFTCWYYTLKQPTEIVIIWKVKPSFLFVNCKFFLKKIIFFKLTEIMKMIGDIFKYFECQNQFQCHWTDGEVVPGWNKYFLLHENWQKATILGCLVSYNGPLGI